LLQSGSVLSLGVSASSNRTYLALDNSTIRLPVAADMIARAIRTI
jgi:hypothetical protein